MGLNEVWMIKMVASNTDMGSQKYKLKFMGSFKYGYFVYVYDEITL